MNVAVIPSQANRIRAVMHANPGLAPRQIAAIVGCHHHLVELTLAQGNKRRPKSVAK